jgi:hypothetical protein
MDREKCDSCLFHGTTPELGNTNDPGRNCNISFEHKLSPAPRSSERANHDLTHQGLVCEWKTVHILVTCFYLYYTFHCHNCHNSGHYQSPCLLFETDRFGDWIVFPPPVGTSSEINRPSLRLCLVLSISPNLLGSTWRRRHNPDSEASGFN